MLAKFILYCPIASVVLFKEHFSENWAPVNCFQCVGIQCLFPATRWCYECFFELCDMGTVQTSTDASQASISQLRIIFSECVILEHKSIDLWYNYAPLYIMSFVSVISLSTQGLEHLEYSNALNLTAKYFIYSYTVYESK